MEFNRETYRDYPAISMSYLKGILIGGSVAHAKAPIRVSQRTLDIGTYTHTAILEPDKWDPIVRDWDLRTKAGKEKQADALQLGKPIVDQTEHDMISAMRASVMSNPTFSEMLTAETREVEHCFLWREPVHEIICKSQIDLITEESGRTWLVDLKTTPSLAGFQKTIFSLHYHMQMAGYAMAARQHGVKIDYVGILAVEKQEPFACQMFVLPESALHIGQLQIVEALQMHVEAEESGIETPPDFVDVDLPAWLFHKYKDVIEEDMDLDPNDWSEIQ